MAHYLYLISYTGEAWGAQVRNPQNRVDAVRPVVESLGGSIETAYLAFGDQDVVLICEFPDNFSAGAFSVAASAGGAIKSIKTTPLMTVDEGIEMMRKAGGSGYRPPGS
jgi:uncharacterized protein with GYD domain